MIGASAEIVDELKAEIGRLKADNDEFYAEIERLRADNDALRAAVNAGAEEVERLRGLSQDNTKYWRTEVERLEAEIAERKAEIQRISENWVRLLHGQE
jgi:predicted RNase H-like nuclease (RuvC/YqgF family)